VFFFLQKRIHRDKQKYVSYLNTWNLTKMSFLHWCHNVRLFLNSISKLLILLTLVLLCFKWDIPIYFYWFLVRNMVTFCLLINRKQKSCYFLEFANQLSKHDSDIIIAIFDKMKVIYVLNKNINMSTKYWDKRHSIFPANCYIRQWTCHNKVLCDVNDFKKAYNCK
jgi:hypothetical protein